MNVFQSVKSGDLLATDDQYSCSCDTAYNVLYDGEFQPPWSFGVSFTDKYLEGENCSVLYYNYIIL